MYIHSVPQAKPIAISYPYRTRTTSHPHQQNLHAQPKHNINMTRPAYAYKDEIAVETPVRDIARRADRQQRRILCLYKLSAFPLPFHILPSCLSSSEVETEATSEQLIVTIPSLPYQARQDIKIPLRLLKNTLPLPPLQRHDVANIPTILLHFFPRASYSCHRHPRSLDSRPQLPPHSDADMVLHSLRDRRPL